MAETERRVQIVDDDDKLIGYKFRREIDYSVDRYRSSALMVIVPPTLWHREPRALFTQRAYSLAEDPGKWGPTVVGKLEEGDGEDEQDEDYDGNIVKETPEEIGVKSIVFKPEDLLIHKKTRKNEIIIQPMEKIQLDGRRRMFVNPYFYEGSVKGIKLNPEEVNASKLISVNHKLATDIALDKYRAEPKYVESTHAFAQLIDIYLESSYFAQFK